MIIKKLLKYLYYHFSIIQIYLIQYFPSFTIIHHFTIGEYTSVYDSRYDTHEENRYAR